MNNDKMNNMKKIVNNQLIQIYGRNLGEEMKLGTCYIVCIQQKKSLKYIIHQ